jgi:hypothetical protein
MFKKANSTRSWVAAICLTAAGLTSSHASVLQGQFEDIYESEFYVVGNDSTALTFTWSARSPDSSGYFYAGGPDAVTVYVASGLADPTTVANAASFSYEANFLTATEGDTVFLRSASGLYAAIALRDFAALFPPVLAPGGFDYVSTLDADWYLDTSGTGNFTGAPIPEPSAYALMLAGLALTAYQLRRRKRAERG